MSHPNGANPRGYWLTCHFGNLPKQIKAYNGKGIENLRPKKQPGRPTKVGHLVADEWSEILSRTPNQYEKLGTDARQWTIELLAELEKRFASGERIRINPTMLTPTKKK